MPVPSSPSRQARVNQRAMWLAQPLSILLELTYSCNWRCVFCYNPRHFDRRRLSAAEWDVVLGDLRALGALTVTLTGGEPLTHPEFLEIAKAVRSRAFALRVFTNGSLIDDRMARELAGLNPLAVEMSLHGACAETHDKTTARPGSFDALLSAVDRLKRHGLRLLLKTPLTRLNETELDGIFELARRLDVPLRVDPTLTPRDDGDSAPLNYRASSAAVARLMRMMYPSGPRAMERKLGDLNCGLGRVTMAIDPEGNVFPCVQWRQTSLGNVRQTRLRDLWQASPVREEAAEISRRANDKLVELGGAVSQFPYCPALSHLLTGNALVPDEGFISRAITAARLRQATP